MGESVDRDAYLALVRALDWGDLTAKLVVHGLTRKHLSPDRTLGVGFASVPRSRLGNYWTQDFGG